MSETQGAGEDFPPGSPQPSPSGQVPPEPVGRAALAWWGAVVCWFLGSLLSRLTGGHVAGNIRFTSARAGDDLLPAPIAVIAFVILAGLWALLVYGMFRGANWARILLSGLGVVGIVNVLIQMLAALTTPEQNTGDILQAVFFLAVVGLSIAGFVLMFRRDTALYFIKRR